MVVNKYLFTLLLTTIAQLILGIIWIILTIGFSMNSIVIPCGIECPSFLVYLSLSSINTIFGGLNCANLILGHYGEWDRTFNEMIRGATTWHPYTGSVILFYSYLLSGFSIIGLLITYFPAYFAVLHVFIYSLCILFSSEMFWKFFENTNNHFTIMV